MNAKTILLLIASSLTASLDAKSISVNFTPVAGDGIDVDADESSVTGIAGAETVAGTGWNNIRTRSAGSSGDPAVFRAQTQGGNHIDLIGSDGADSGVDLTSAGTFFFNFSQVSNPSQAATGDGGMMQSYLLSNASETISLSGLAAWAPGGYRVIAFFDIGDQGPRVYGLKGSDGITTQSFFTNDSDSNSGGGVDTDADNDGIIEWKLTTETSSGTAVVDANHAIFGTFTGDTFTLSGADATRAVISGLQIVAIEEPGVPFLGAPQVGGVTGTGAQASVQLVNAAATDLTLFWGTIDQGAGSWPNSEPLGPRTIGPVNGTISGLAPDVLCYYRFRAINDLPDPDFETWSAAGTSFVTAFAGKAVSNLEGSLFDVGVIDLAWIDNFDHETGFSVRRSENPGGPYTEVAVVPPGTTFHTDSDPTLAQGATYHYVVVALGPNGNSDLPGEVSVTNGSAPPPAPVTAAISVNHTLDKGNNGLNPRPLSKTDVAGLLPDSNWNNLTLINGFSNPSPHANNAVLPAGSLRDSGGAIVAGASYAISSTDGWGQVFADFPSSFSRGDRKMFSENALFGAGDNFSLVVDGLPPAFTGNGYRVIIYTMINASSRTAEMSLTPEGGDELTYPFATENSEPSLPASTTGRFRLSVDAASPGNYIFFDVPAGIDGFTFGVNATTGGRAPINGVQIVAANNPILVEPGVASATTTDAQAGATLQQSDADVTLLWDTVDQGVGGTWTHALALGTKSPGPVAGTIGGLTPDTRVFYRLFARNAATGLEAWTAESTSFATALTGKAVSGLAGTLFGPDAIDLEWKDDFQTETGFSIRRSATPGGPFLEIATVAADTEYYTDLAPLAGDNHYVVVAVNESGPSDPSNEVSVSNGSGNTFATWIDGFDLDPADRDPGDDPDGDRLDNLVEGFLGTNPGRANPGLGSVATNGNVTTFTHPQADPPLGDVSGFYEWSLDLVTWYAGDGVAGPPGGPTVAIPPVSPVAGTASATATASEPVGRLFIRLAVTR
jgi:hypothetical protein